MRFRYTARGIDGRWMTGEMIADTPEEATGRLQEAGVYVTSVVPMETTGGLFPPRLVLLSEAERLFLVESWAMFLEAGLPMQSALLRLRMRARNRSLAKALEWLQRALDEGVSFTSALKQARIFPPSWVEVLSLGELHGDFVQPLKMLYRHALEFGRLRSQILTLMLMPSILLGLVLVWLWIFLLKVGPALATFLMETGATAPLLYVMTAVAKAVLAGAPWVGGAGLALFLWRHWTRSADREMGPIQSWMPTWLPIVGPLVSQWQLILLASGLQLQMEAGIPVVTAVENLSRGMPHRGIRLQLTEAHRSLSSGVPLSEALVPVKVIPPSAQALIGAGEVSGKLPEMLAFLVRETESILFEQLERLIVVIRSFVILATGILVGLTVITFFGILFSGIGNFLNASTSPLPASL